jgi:hypothetical protein
VLDDPATPNIDEWEHHYVLELKSMIDTHSVAVTEFKPEENEKEDEPALSSTTRTDRRIRAHVEIRKKLLDTIGMCNDFIL